jgi:hypothetical protein
LAELINSRHLKKKKMMGRGNEVLTEDNVVGTTGRPGFLSPARYKPEKREQGSPITPTLAPVRELRSRHGKKSLPKIFQEELKRLVELGKANAVKVKELLSQIGLVAIDNAGKGNCMFLAIARGLGWSSQAHRKLRNIAVKHMEDNSEDFRHFIPYTDLEGPDKAWERYLNKMRKKGWGGPHELRALEASLNIKFEIWLATFNELEEVTDIQVQRHHPVNLEKGTVKLWYEANAQNDTEEDLGDHYMVLEEDGSGRHLSRVSRYSAMTLDESKSTTEGDGMDKTAEGTQSPISLSDGMSDSQRGLNEDRSRLSGLSSKQTHNSKTTEMGKEATTALNNVRRGGIWSGRIFHAPPNRTASRSPSPSPEGLWTLHKNPTPRGSEVALGEGSRPTGHPPPHSQEEPQPDNHKKKGRMETPMANA